jgi:hypothetical protein
MDQLEAGFSVFLLAQGNMELRCCFQEPATVSLDGDEVTIPHAVAPSSMVLFNLEFGCCCDTFAVVI